MTVSDTRQPLDPAWLELARALGRYTADQEFARLRGRTSDIERKIGRQHEAKLRRQKSGKQEKLTKL